MRGFTRGSFIGLLSLCGGASVASGCRSTSPETKQRAPTETVVASTNERGAPSFLWAAPPSSHAPSPLTTLESAARSHLEGTASRYGLSAQALATAEVVQVDRASNLVVFRQRIDGIDVIESDAKVLMNARQELVAIGGGLHPAGLRSTKHGRFDVPPVGALSRARPVYFPVGARLVPAYVIERREGQNAYELVVAASDGRVLRRTDLTKRATYRVFADADGHPTDGPLVDTTPYPKATIDDSLTPSYAASRLVTVDGFNTKKDPWLPADATETKGNNVDAYTDDGAPDDFSPGDVRASMTSANTFDRPYDFTAEPDANDTQRMAVVTQAFFVTNWLHDYWYDSGFDEVAGNPQSSNFGRGGQEGDPLLVKVQYGIGLGSIDNALAIPTADGVAPALHFYLFSKPEGGSVRRDSALENTVVAHEWGHVLHRRLVGGDNAQVAAMSEGWADFVALHMLLRPGNDLAGTYAVGTSLASARSGASIYWGLRRVPYSTDFLKNDLTFHHLAGGTINAPHNTSLDPASYEAHNAGEVWATALFEVYVALQKRATGGAYSFDEARRRMASYVVAGMKLAPNAPTFTEQRDALIAAAVAKDADDAAAFVKAFALRGLGSCAVSPDRSSTMLDGVVESFDTKPSATIGAITFDAKVTSCDDDAYLDAGETGRATVRISNSGTLPVTGAKLTASSTLAGVTFPKGASVSVPTIPPFSSTEVSVEVSLVASTTDPRLLDLSFALDAAGACASAPASVTYPANIDEKSEASARDRVEALSTTWTTKDILAETVAATIWRRIEKAPGDHAWHADNSGARSDTALESPAIVVSAATAFTLSFSHRYQFEFDENQGTFYDGAVVEISSDGGLTWENVATYATSADYSRSLGHPDATNPLVGMTGFGGTSPEWPASTTSTFDFGAKLAGKTVKLRFRVGTDSFTGAYGWDIDDITLTGANTPFAALAVDSAPCITKPDAGRPSGEAGPSFPAGDVDPDAGTKPPVVAPAPEDDGCGVAHAPASRTSWLVGLALFALARRRARRR